MRASGADPLSTGYGCADYSSGMALPRALPTACGVVARRRRRCQAGGGGALRRADQQGTEAKQVAAEEEGVKREPYPVGAETCGGG